MDVTGHCHCGAISFRASIDPEKVSICHCTDCQQISGSPYRVSVPAPAEGFKLLTGAPKLYVKTAESGNKRAQGFCGNCGSHVFATAPGPNPPAYSLRVGTLEQRAQLAPKRQIWCRSAMEWAGDIEGIPGVDKQ
jgi:hypothetical protein